jgi:hypothetical protein
MVFVPRRRHVWGQELARFLPSPASCTSCISGDDQLSFPTLRDGPPVTTHWRLTAELRTQEFRNLEYRRRSLRPIRQRRSADRPTAGTAALGRCPFDAPISVRVESASRDRREHHGRSRSDADDAADPNGPIRDGSRRNGPRIRNEPLPRVTLSKRVNASS